ncbi:aryl-sulfate sulfotransferase [Pseudenhygromyxa sp. WMMC2535]|uniref:aryl-sulfate sulfotransferase n=1 Tax=Pseudenhygromyxa sp. WMMC2535 TaxID=2712867 RepID=UPI001595EF03|nr:aryl-sulfate sulfotransferase [Pseudenhygromyxa sp. WMMC2535]NVB37512.1 aryl-sulfate sulfotransferase [Pseudenhygromyxa sp. WMMC2535]
MASLRSCSTSLLFAPLLAATALAGCGDEADPAELSGEPELILHENQPMIVDVIAEFDAPVDALELAEDADPGVRVEVLAVEDDGRRYHFRARGLAPDSAHSLSLRWPDGETSLDFETGAALPGFIPSFTVEQAAGAEIDPAFRIFDYSVGPDWSPNGLTVVDTEGVTRWYFGSDPIIPGPTAVWAGIELLSDGTLLTARDGAVIILDELGEVQRRHDSYSYGLSAFHHEATLLDNGNILTLSNSFETVDYSTMGWGELLVAADLLVEIDPAGDIVWTWDAFDHIDPLRVTEIPGAGLPYVDTTTGDTGYDWTHGNGMMQIEGDLILLSMRHQDWIVAIDHQSGEIVWRLGPEGDFELLAGTWFYHQHSPQLQADGSLLLYDNAVGNPELGVDQLSSRAVRYALDLEAMTATQVWDDRDSVDTFVSTIAGDADRMPTGRIMVTDSAMHEEPGVFEPAINWSRIRELDEDAGGEALWTLRTEPGSFVYRATTTDMLPGEGQGALE